MNITGILKVLVTGANGFIGRAVVRYLRYKGMNVIESTKNGEDEYALDLLELARGIKYDNNQFFSMLSKVDVVVHLAGLAHFPKNISNKQAIDLIQKINVDATVGLGRLAASAGVKKFIFISSSKVYADLYENKFPLSINSALHGQSIYARCKILAEQGLSEIAADSYMGLTILRPPLVYGVGVKANFERLSRFIIKSPVIPMPYRSSVCTRSFISTDNLSDLIYTCILKDTSSTPILNATDNVDISTFDLVKTIARIAKKESAVCLMPTMFDTPIQFLFNGSDAFKSLITSEALDISETRDLLMWAPPFTLQQSMEDYINNMMKNKF